jgi:hypothetical protein
VGGGTRLIWLVGAAVLLAAGAAAGLVLRHRRRTRKA